LEYHIKRCKAPCIGLESLEEYQEHIGIIKEILKGNISQVSKVLYEKMQKKAEELKYEEAEELKEKYITIENYRSKSTVVTPTLHNIDVFAIEDDEHSAYINFMHIGNGAIVQAFTFEYKKRLDETKEELLGLGIVEMRERFKSEAKEIIVPFAPDTIAEEIEITIPQRGDKKKLLDLSVMNVKQYKVDKLKQAEKLNPEQRNTRLLREIQEALKLETLPKRIELFDNSNISGSYPVAACVVFVMGKPSKKDYRKYNIKTVEGPDDYASMAEVVRRRYKRVMDEKETLPDLILTDGGKGQIDIVHQVVYDELGLKIPIGGLAKDNRHRTAELLYGYPPETVGMKLDSPLFHLLTKMQDEVHRFAITFHKEKRSKGQTKSELDQIKGIGDKTKVVLLRKYKSIKRIRETDESELIELIGEAKAKLIKEGLKGTEK
jgi:excinuclease ABC subunit C